MSEHAEFMGKDVYFWNFIVLMFFTLFEVGAVFFEGIPKATVWGILIVVGLIKGFGIAAFFMHLKDEHKWFNITFMFPWIFVALMLWGIGLSNPEGVTGLPSWCTPDWSYATER
ncbi:MAG: cytochrome C oxidase subunit IV family protein [Candidatus Poseidoniaceae archaeon]|nr:cytochrome C oxidase subunit IV family protein [Candidatus Poseidoniaceae archaeon]MDG1557614.1 cytochrome C oxidase subunit IV family protein [Candidatus Poseidoniaceae archaeon]MDG1559473.1 cytochrome C oxidase subunit IV family protein [Candidatus Poseidoniaceae archaeon]